MKKYFMGIITCMILLSVLVFAAAENSELPTSGTWYSSFSGIPVRLKLSEDGSYISDAPGAEPVTAAGRNSRTEHFSPAAAFSLLHPV